MIAASQISPLKCNYFKLHSLSSTAACCNILLHLYIMYPEAYLGGGLGFSHQCFWAADQ